MIDIKLIRDNAKLVKENIKKKFQKEKLKLLDDLILKDKNWRELKSQVDELRSERNKVSKEIAKAKKENKDSENLLKSAKEIPKKILEKETKSKKLKLKIDELLKQIPNIIHESVPIGKSSKENVEIEKIGIPKKFSFDIKNHSELGEDLGILDFESSSKISGKGFYILKGDLALLNQALINFARDFMVSKGYEYIEPPLMIREEVLRGVYSKAEIDAMAYKIEGEDSFLIATSEHPVIGMFANKNLNYKDLPIKLTAYSMCFRKEIGSHGVDEKGLFRTHQFNKQEMVIICEPKDSYKYYDELMDLSKQLFKKLKLPIRELESCSGDLSDLKSKGADLEFWRPRLNEYNEIGSVSNMEESQARRLNIKYFDKDGERKFVHTLNNTAIATSRALVGILENYQQKNGSIKIPEALIPYVNGKKLIEKNSNK